MGPFLTRQCARAAGILSFVVAFSLIGYGQTGNRTTSLVVPATGAGHAAQSAVANRIAVEADWSRVQRLRNQVPLWANAQNSTGLAKTEMALTMVLSRTPAQQGALEKLLADQKNPASPDFHG